MTSGIVFSMKWFLLLILITTCDSLDSSGNQPGDLRTSAGLLSVPKGKVKSIEILNYDADGDYTVTPKGTDKGLFEPKKSIDEKQKKLMFNFKAKGEIGEQEYELGYTSRNGEKKSRIVTVRINDPKVMDMKGDATGLLMKYTNDYTFAYNDSKTGAINSFTACNPKIEKDSDWYSLGSTFIATLFYCDTKKYPSILLKDNSREKNLLKPPRDYELIWNDKGSKGQYGGSIWKPIPHKGYVAMGVVAVKGYGKPNETKGHREIMTVRKDLTIEGEKGDRIYSDADSGAYKSVRIYEIRVPNPPVINDLSLAPLLPETAIAEGTGGKLSPRILLYKKMVIDKGTDNVEPRLTGPEPYVGYDTFQAVVKMPFTASEALRKDRNRIPDLIEKYPFVYVQRQEQYKHVHYLDNRQGSGEGSLAYSATESFEETDEKSWGGSVGFEFSYAHEGSSGVVTTSYSVSLSVEFNWNFTSSTTYGRETSKEVTVAVPPGKFVEVLQINNLFRTFRLEPDGERTYIGRREGAKGSLFKVLEYPPN